MPRNARSNVIKRVAPRDTPVPADEKIARLLALIATRGINDKQEQVGILRAAGFEIAETASLLQMSENNVSVMMYRARKTRSKPARRK